VGEIEDEFDSGHDAGDIFTLADGSYRIAGDTALERVNEAFDVHLPLQEFETLAGLVSHELGHVPRRNEIVSLHGLNLRVMHTKGGVVKWFKVTLEQAA
jgi:magnesium and cobalt transporter